MIHNNLQNTVAPDQNNGYWNKFQTGCSYALGAAGIAYTVWELYQNIIAPVCQLAATYPKISATVLALGTWYSMSRSRNTSNYNLREGLDPVNYIESSRSVQDGYRQEKKIRKQCADTIQRGNYRYQDQYNNALNRLEYSKKLKKRLGKFRPSENENEDIDNDMKYKKPGIIHKILKQPKRILGGSSRFIKSCYNTYMTTQFTLLKYGFTLLKYGLIVSAILAVPVVVAASLYYHPLPTIAAAAVLGTAGLYYFDGEQPEITKEDYYNARNYEEYLNRLNPQNYNEDTDSDFEL